MAVYQGELTRLNLPPDHFLQRPRRAIYGRVCGPQLGDNE